MLRFSLILIASVLLGLNFLPAQASEVAVDAVNQYDENGLKTGHWIITGEMVSSAKYKPGQKVEEGTYLANKREGVWKKYYTNGNLNSEITYVNNRPHGPYKLFYPTGGVQEDGNWIRERNTGSFKRYHLNGKVSQEFFFTDYGLRTGTQLYYYENGNVELQVEIVDGLEEGEMRRYYPNGALMERKMLSNGVVEQGTVEKFPMPTEVRQEDFVRSAPEEKRYSVRNTEDKPNLEVFRHNGRNVLYNKNRQVSQVGEFRDGRLWNGKWKRYDTNGIIEKIEIYREGVYIGTAPITEDDL